MGNKNQIKRIDEDDRKSLGDDDDGDRSLGDPDDADDIYGDD